MSNRRIVFDTNVTVSATLLPRSVPRRAIDLAILRGRILISNATIFELERFCAGQSSTVTSRRRNALSFLLLLLLRPSQLMSWRKFESAVIQKTISSSSWQSTAAQAKL
jgi:predicted nucleic acid-binding protein